MSCDTHIQLRDFQMRTAANLRSVIANKGDIASAQNSADAASANLDKHIAGCPICNPAPSDPSAAR